MRLQYQAPTSNNRPHSRLSRYNNTFIPSETTLSSLNIQYQTPVQMSSNNELRSLETTISSPNKQYKAPLETIPV